MIDRAPAEETEPEPETHWYTLLMPIAHPDYADAFLGVTFNAADDGDAVSQAERLAEQYQREAWRLHRLEGESLVRCAG